MWPHSNPCLRRRTAKILTAARDQAPAVRLAACRRKRRRTHLQPPQAAQHADSGLARAPGGDNGVPGNGTSSNLALQVHVLWLSTSQPWCWVQGCPCASPRAHCWQALHVPAAGRQRVLGRTQRPGLSLHRPSAAPARRAATTTKVCTSRHSGRWQPLAQPLVVVAASLAGAAPGQGR